MARLACPAAVSAIFLFAGCADELVELPTDRRPAVPVPLVDGPSRCPADTVVLSDDDPESGAGAVPADFDSGTVLRCDVDYTTMRTRNGVDQFTVTQWQAPMTPQLRTALDLPDREIRPVRACAAGSGRTTAVYLVDSRRQAIRVLLPVDDPCQQIRKEVAALLPADGSPAEATFHVSRPTR